METISKNRAAMLMKAHDLQIVDVPVPASPGPGQATIQIVNLGICGSDCHYLSHGHIGGFVVRAPMIIGHECAGVVVALGPGVDSLAVGDKVALEPGLPCRRCHFCKTGEYNLCPGMQFFATPPVHGSLTLYLNHDADFCHRLPESLTLEQGAMCEPLSVGVYACERAGLRPGQTVAIFGAGPIGLVSMLVARAFGARHIAITDVSQERLRFAKKLGADTVVNVSNRSEADIVAELIAGNHGEHFSISIDCCGFESAIRTAIGSTTSGGSVVLVGMGSDEVRLPLIDAACRQVDLRGVFRYRNTYPTCIHLQAQGKFDVRPLITHRFDLHALSDESALRQGFEIASTGRDGAIKVMFKIFCWILWARSEIIYLLIYGDGFA